jgi:hypothetical protein
MENVKQDMVEEGQKPYNIRHRCFHFAKEVMTFVSECKYERIHFSIFDQLIRSATSVVRMWSREVQAIQRKILLIFSVLLLSQLMRLNTGFA